MKKTNVNLLPTPYEDELLYSILARYHRHSSHVSLVATARDLFFDNTPYRLKAFYFGEWDKRFLTLWPKNIKTPEDIMCRYTLEPFVLRYSSIERRQEMLAFARGTSGPVRIPTMERKKVGQSLHYCPICCKEDKEKYGEMYWHRSHQIQCMLVCPKHLCRLESSPVSISRSAWHLFAADEVTCPVKEPDMNTTYGERVFSEYLCLALISPFSFRQEPKIGYLQGFLEAGGYIKDGLKETRHKGEILYTDMQAVLGAQLMESFFSSETKFKYMYWRMVGERSCPTTEYYMLLAAYLEIPPELLFKDPEEAPEGKALIESPLYEQMREMQKTGYLWSRGEVAKQLEVYPWEVAHIAKAAGIPRFWLIDPPKEVADTEVELRISRITLEQKAKIVRRAQELGAGSTSEYIKYCIRKDIDL